MAHNQWHSTHKRAFSTLYGVFVLVFVSMCVGFVVLHSPIAPIAHIHAKTQLDLYENSLYEATLKCLDNFGFDECKNVEFVFPHNYTVKAVISDYDGVYLLDTFVSLQNPITTTQQSIINRHIVLKK